jgi:hypothetical protein
MPTKAVLLASDHVFTRLRQEGLLRPNQLGDHLFDKLDPSAEPFEDKLIVRIRPEEFAEDGADAERVDRLMAQLLQCLVCHLAVLGDDAADGQITLDALLDWHAAFGRSAERIAEHRRHYEHVLVIVAAAPLGAGALRRIESLLNDKASGVKTVYFMSPDLELGKGKFFHARHVWPIAVSLLLYRLVAADLGPDEEGRILAWRGRVIEPAVNDRPATEELAAARHHALARYRQQVATPLRPQESKPLSVGREAIDDPHLQSVPVGAPAFWQEFAAIRETEQTLDPKRWQDQFRREGRKFIQQRSRRLMTAMDALEAVVSERWRDVHLDPAYLYEQQRSVEEVRPQLQDRIDQVHRHTESLKKADRELQQSRETLRTDAKEFELASGHYLDFGLRLGAGVLVALAIVWASHVVYFYFGLLQAWLWIGAAGLLGATLPATALWLVERFCGERGVDDLQKRYREFDELTRSRYLAAWELFDAASQFNIDLRSFAAWRHMQRLLRRAEAIVDVAFDASPALARGAADTTDGVPPPATAENRARELSEFRAASYSVLHSSRIDLSAPVDFDAIVEAETAKMRRSWASLCDRSDPEHRGTLTIRLLLPMLSKMRHDFYLAVEAELAQRIFAHSGPELQQQCIDAAKAQYTAAWHYGMSAASPDRGFSDLRRLILLNPRLQGAIAQAHNAGLAPHECQALAGTTVCAIAHDEIVLSDVAAASSMAAGTAEGAS